MRLLPIEPTPLRESEYRNLAGLGCFLAAVAAACLETHPPTLMVRGHKHWPQPLSTLGHGGQVLNVDARAVLLKPRRHGS